MYPFLNLATGIFRLIAFERYVLSEDGVGSFRIVPRFLDWMDRPLVFLPVGARTSGTRLCFSSRLGVRGGSKFPLTLRYVRLSGLLPYLPTYLPTSCLPIRLPRNAFGVRPHIRAHQRCSSPVNRPLCSGTVGQTDRRLERQRFSRNLTHVYICTELYTRIRRKSHSFRRSRCLAGASIRPSVEFYSFFSYTHKTAPCGWIWIDRFRHFSFTALRHNAASHFCFSIVARRCDLTAVLVPSLFHHAASYRLLCRLINPLVVGLFRRILRVAVALGLFPPVAVFARDRFGDV